MVYLTTLWEPQIISAEEYYNTLIKYLWTNWHSDTNKKIRDLLKTIFPFLGQELSGRGYGWEVGFCEQGHITFNSMKSKELLEKLR
jgi:hypothetical protein